MEEGLFAKAEKIAAKQDYSTIDMSAPNREEMIQAYEMKPYLEYLLYSFERQTGVSFHMADTFFKEPHLLRFKDRLFKRKWQITDSEEFEII